MQLKSSKTLVFLPSDDALTGYNFLKGEVFETQDSIFSFMHSHDDWKEVPTCEKEEYEDALQAGVLVEQDSELYSLESSFEKEWVIGMPAAMFHFSLMDREHKNIEYNEEFQKEKSKHTPSPPLYECNQSIDSVTLQKPENDAIVELMQRRRTERELEPGKTELSTVSDMLYCSLGITGFTENSVGKLPLKMTPSGGARNPYEAYVFARNIEGLAPGIYHYSALEHSLAKVAPLPNEPLGSFIGDQEWADDKNALIVLVAYMERSMWKYEDPNIYRAILIEAGHIGQNMMLIATRDNQTLCPTAALKQTMIMEAAKIDKKVTRSPMYVMALGANTA